MANRIIVVSSSAYCSTKDNQLVLALKDKNEEHRVPLEDIGLIELDHPSITLTTGLMSACAEYGVAIISTGSNHHPNSITLPLYGNQLHTERLRAQVGCSVPQQKRAWKELIEHKIDNQIRLLSWYGGDTKSMRRLLNKVRSGDPDNIEAQTAQIYWKQLFCHERFSVLPYRFSPRVSDSADSEADTHHHLDGYFRRARDGKYPNQLLNYGYSILRALVARGIVQAGLHPALGIHYHHRNNPFCLADDLMEPYRPFVDTIVCHIIQEYAFDTMLMPELKRKLLAVSVADTHMGDVRRPLITAVEMTCASLWQYYAQERTSLALPTLCLAEK